VLETYRECLQDVFESAGAEGAAGGHPAPRHPRGRGRIGDGVAVRAIAGVAYVAAYMYEGDAPLAERRAQALTLDRQLLRELLGHDELAALLDPAALDEVEAEAAGDRSRAAGCATPTPRTDLLRRVGDLSQGELAARAEAGVEAQVPDWLRALAATHQAAEVRVAGETRWIAAEDLARYRDALGVQPPAGTPLALLGGSGTQRAGIAGRALVTHARTVRGRAGRDALWSDARSARAGAGRRWRGRGGWSKGTSAPAARPSGATSR